MKTEQRMNMDTMPLRWGHYRVLIISSMGQIVGAGLATLIGIIIPMIQLVAHPALASWQQGLVGCTSLIGITIGSLLFGRLSDKYGYLFFFRLCPLIVLVASVWVYWVHSLPALVTGLFLMGLGIGGGYSLDSDYISEIMPQRWRLFMVGVAKALSALGNILVAVLCYFLLKQWEEPQMWNRLLLIISVFAVIMILSRIRFTQSPRWLMAHGRPAQAEAAVRYLLGKDVEVIEKGQPVGADIHHHIGEDIEVGEIRNRIRKRETPKVSWADLFRGTNLKRVIFSGIPWACEGLGVYGIGIFLPILVMSLGLEPADTTNPFLHIINSVEITAWISVFILLGFILGLVLVNRWYHVRIQFWGFVLCSAGLVILYIGYRYHLPVEIAIAGFMIFELFLNAGPHLMTFIIPSQIYPVADRGEGAGIAAALGKVGAVLGVLFIPMLLDWGGIELVLGVSVLVLLTGAAVTAVVGKEVLPDKRQRN